MSIRSFAVAVATLSVISASVIASASIVGTWKGKIHISDSALAKVPQQYQAMAKSQMAMVAKLTVILSLSKDKTFKVSTTGLPQQAAASQDSGTWSQSGSSLILKSKKKPGSPQTFTIAKDGKTISIALPRDQGSLVFSK